MVLALALDFQSAASATIADAPGENFAVDLSTGLRWLDLTETAGLSYTAVLEGSGNTWLADGWRYASTDEIKYLLESNLPSFTRSISIEGDPQPGDFYAAWQPDDNGEGARLASILGNTNSLIGVPFVGATGVYGRQVVRAGVPQPIHSIAALVSTDFGGGDVQFLATMQGGAFDTEGHSYIGHFLVMPFVVAEPPSWLLLLFVVGLLPSGRNRTGRKMSTFRLLAI